MVCGVGKTSKMETRFDNIIRYLQNGNEGLEDLVLWSRRADSPAEDDECSGDCYNSIYLYPLETAGFIEFRGELNRVYLTEKGKQLRF